MFASALTTNWLVFHSTSSRNILLVGRIVTQAPVIRIQEMFSGKTVGNGTISSALESAVPRYCPNWIPNPSCTCLAGPDWLWYSRIFSDLAAASTAKWSASCPSRSVSSLGIMGSTGSTIRLSALLECSVPALRSPVSQRVAPVQHDPSHAPPTLPAFSPH